MVEIGGWMVDERGCGGWADAGDGSGSRIDADADDRRLIDGRSITAPRRMNGGGVEAERRAR
jgi:hypothetical protein